MISKGNIFLAENSKFSVDKINALHLSWLYKDKILASYSGSRITLEIIQIAHWLGYFLWLDSVSYYFPGCFHPGLVLAILFKTTNIATICNIQLWK